jgi:hypothetical protein
MGASTQVLISLFFAAWAWALDCAGSSKSRRSLVSKPTVSYEPRRDTTPEAELNVLAVIYRFVLDCHAKKEAAPESRPDDAKGSKHDSRQQHCTG